MLEINTITTPFVFHITVNCYLVKTPDGFVLIDTSKAGNRQIIEQALSGAGCKPGDLKLIILTHGDFDHCGNAAYLREQFDAPIAIHEADKGMVEAGDMFWNRKQPNVLMRTLTGLLFRLNPEDRFKPDFYLKAGDNLSRFGFDATVIELPGHSRGSIGLLTAEDDLFCGDLLANVDKPAVWSIIDDVAAAKASVEKLKGKHIYMVYPGHGRPFPMQAFIRYWQPATTPVTA